MIQDSDFIATEMQGQGEVLFDSGGTADCYKLIKDNRLYCIKRPKPQHRESEAYMSLFRKEFELGIELEHPNIVRYFAYDTDNHGPFIRMDYVDGDNLEEFIAQHPEYFHDKNNRKQFLDELFSAIDYLHKKGLLHLDLKPNNILITTKGNHVKLIDLGFGWSESFIHDLGFTRDYCAPEQLSAKTDLVSPATDLYALGKILHRFGLAKDSVVEHCLLEDPSERPQSIGELKRLIRNGELKSKGSKVLLGMAGIAVIGVLTWFIFGQPEATPVTERTDVPEGAVNGLFTINEAGDQVYFSKGNLQYKPYTNTWRFAENQYDFIGGDNSNTYNGANHRGWMDLFSWSANGRQHGSIIYQPWILEAEDLGAKTSLYSAYGIDSCNLGDHDGQADWGYNAISNGGNEEGLWRTLTMEEWLYLLDTRNTTSGMRFAKANVEGVNGLLLLPDNWDIAFYNLNHVNDDDIGYLSNTIPQPYWKEKLEVHGAVFLPAAGIRDVGTVGLIGTYGFYWSATHHGIRDALGIYFSNSFFNHENITGRYQARSVRLVREVGKN